MSRKFEYEFPYENVLPVQARAWLAVFIKADLFANANHFIALGVSEADLHRVKVAAELRKSKFKRDAFSNLKNISSVDDQILPLVVYGGGEHENIIDLSREVATRSKFKGYGNATGLRYAKRVQLTIDSHYLNGRTGMVISPRHDEWLVHFDNGMKGYFKASELSNIQEQAILLGGVA